MVDTKVAKRMAASVTLFAAACFLSYLSSRQQGIDALTFLATLTVFGIANAVAWETRNGIFVLCVNAVSILLFAFFHFVA